MAEDESPESLRVTDFDNEYSVIDYIQSTCLIKIATHLTTKQPWNL